MVETRRQRRRSRSDLSEKAPQKQESAAKEQEEEKDTRKEEKVEKVIEDDTDEENDNEKKQPAVDDEEKPVNDNRDYKDEPSKGVESTPQKGKPAKLPAAHKKDKKVQEPKNGLSKIIPGYRAPLQLAAPSLERYRPAGGLDALRRKAVQTDPSTAAVAVGTKQCQERVKAMLDKTPYGGLSSPFTAACTSFKKASKRPAPNHAGDGWFGMEPTPMTDELKRDLALIRDRNYLDPKRFYKSSDPAGKFLQVGTVVEGPSEFYSARLSKKQRRSNLVEEVMHDPSTASYAQNKYKQMQQEKTKMAVKRRRKGRR